MIYREPSICQALLPVHLCDCFIESGWAEAHWDPSWLLSSNEALSTSPSKVGHKQESGLWKVAQRELQSVPWAEKKKRWRKSKRGRGREKNAKTSARDMYPLHSSVTATVLFTWIYWKLRQKEFIWITHMVFKKK